MMNLAIATIATLTMAITPMSGTVTNVYDDANIITITDSTGNEWDWEGIEDWELGDGVLAIMDTKGTLKVEDDELLTIRYCEKLNWAYK